MITVCGVAGSGRTGALARWLIEGREVPGYPGWSRMLVVPNASDVPRIMADYPDVQHELRAVFRPALGKLVISVEELRHVRVVCDRDVTFAIDDADWIIAQALGLRPTVISVEGMPATPTNLPGVTQADSDR